MMTLDQTILPNNVQHAQNTSILNRPRLNKLLETALGYPLVTVYAGAGYGKTRMVYSFLQSYNAQVTWLQISQRDNMGTRFWENFTHVVSLTHPTLGARFSEIGFPSTIETFEKFERILREIGDLPERHIIVCDDFHLLINPEVVGFFNKAANILPSNMTLIVISRTTPGVNLVELMVHERVFTIREDALRFTEDEITSYFGQLVLPIARQNIRDIYDDTQGWAFAVNLIGRSLRRDLPYERYALDAMKQNIFMFIDTELSRTVSQELLLVLLRISLIDHLAAGLIRILVKDETLLKEMEQLNAYIRYDSFLDAYVIHHLFLDYLRQRSSLLSEEERHSVYMAAGAWCEENSQFADAMSYYEKSGDYDAIARIVASLNVQIPQDLARYALEVFDRAPDEAAAASPIFPAMYLKLKINLGQYKDVMVLAEQYVKNYEAAPESPQRNRGLAAVYATWALMRLHMCTYTDTYDFDTCFAKMNEYYEKSPFTVIGAYESLSVSAWASLVGSSRKEAQEEYLASVTRAIPYISHVLNEAWIGFDDLVRGELCYYRGKYNEAEEHLKHCIEKAKECGQYDTQNRARVYLMQIAFIRGDHATASARLQETKEFLNQNDYTFRYEAYDIAYGLYQLALGQPEQTPDWLKDDFSPFAHPSSLDNYANQVKLQYHYQTRQYSALMAFIESVGGQGSVLFGKIELKILEALLLYQHKERDKAIISLAQAYSLAESNAIITPFIQHGKDMRTLTAAALREHNHSIPVAWIENINRKSSAYSKRRASMISDYKATHHIEETITLTKRETEVLRDLAQGLSRTEIAASQNISANTVKMIINILYEKLCANNLADAVRIASERKII